MMADSSTKNIKAILAHPAIVETFLIDRTTLKPTEITDVSVAYWLDDRYPALSSAIGTFDKRVRPFAILPVCIASLLIALAGMKDGRRWLANRVPPMSPIALGAFRITFALSLMRVVYWTAYRGSTNNQYGLICFVLLTLFLVGAASRVAFIGFVAAFFVSIATQNRITEHDFALPLRTLWLLTLVPWGGGALSVDANVRRRMGRPPTQPSRWYGLATWLPIVMLGVAYAGAAYAKLDEGGLGWITRGAVRYFLVIDAHNAPTNLGRLVAAHEGLCVALSAAAIAVEIAVILAAIWPRPLRICLVGCAAASFQASFWFFQGLYWPAWWALFPAFLPWDWIVSKLARKRTQPTLAYQVVATTKWGCAAGVLVFLAVFQQPFASMMRRDLWFLMSDFPMYSDLNFDSPEAYATYADTHDQPPPLVQFSVPGGNAELPRRVKSIDSKGAVTAAVLAMARSVDPSPSDLEEVQRVAAHYREQFGPVAQPVRITVSTWRFDWSVADFVPRADATLVASWDLASGRLSR